MLYLTPDEVCELTDRRTAPAQAKRLQAMGIRFIYRKGGKVKVAANDVPNLRPNDASHDEDAEPDFSMFERRDRLKGRED
jgi:hypothetical protein